MLIAQTGGIESVYLALFMLVLLFAAPVGIAGVVTAGMGLIGLVIYLQVTASVGGGALARLALIGGLPILASLILWFKPETAGSGITESDKSYHELASQLSQVSGKSEVVISAIADGVVALNSQGIIQLFNPASERLLGWGNRDALGLSYKSVIRIFDAKNQQVTDANDPIEQALNLNKPVKSENFSIQTQSGKSFLANISVSPIGQPGEGVIVVFRDVTDEKSDERQRAEFISTASHEMRTPVASIEGYLGIALNPKIATIDDKARDYITKAHASAQHLGRLFSDLLDVSKADDGRLKNDPRVLDVVPFIHDIVEGLAPKASEKGLIMFYKPMPTMDAEPNQVEKKLTPVFYANVDNDHLREVVQNLVENAIKYTPAGQVVVDVIGDDNHITISVADTGLGIPREDQSHLFQKFYRVDTSATREIGGTGLGLYLCRRLTETIGGRIWVESEYQKGSTFLVEIPRIDHDEAMRLIDQAKLADERPTVGFESATPSEGSMTTILPISEPVEPLETAEPPIMPAVQPAPTPVATNPSPVPTAPVAVKIPIATEDLAPPTPNYIADAFAKPIAAPAGPGAVTAAPVTNTTQAPTPLVEPLDASQHHTVAVTPPAPEPVFVTNPQIQPHQTLSAIEANPRQYLNQKRAETSRLWIPSRGDRPE